MLDPAVPILTRCVTRHVCEDEGMSGRSGRSSEESHSPEASPGPGDAPGYQAGPESDGSSAITELGHDVFQIDTRMAGYHGITAG